MALVRFIASIAERVLIWCICRAAEAQGVDLKLVRPAANEYVRRATRDAMLAARWNTNEARIQEERLTKRFDLGAALNEGANRAIAAKQGERREMTLEEQARASGLTDRQIEALKFQKGHLERVVARS